MGHNGINNMRNIPRSGSMSDVPENSDPPSGHQQRMQALQGSLNTSHPAMSATTNNLHTSPTAMNMNTYGSMPDMDRSGMQVNEFNGASMASDMPSSNPLHTPLGPPPGYPNYDNQYNIQSQYQPNGLNSLRFSGSAETPPASFLGVSPAAPSPAWLSLPSPGSINYQSHIQGPTASILRYPALNPIIPHISNILPLPVACDLLELYFTSSSAALMRPLSPYLLGYVFRKKSFLHPVRPRRCSPALLASMLWVAAQTSDAAFLTSPPSARGRVCQKLLELTVGLLRPLIHGPTGTETSPQYSPSMVINGVALGGFGVTTDHLGTESGATATLDDVATYLHLATVVSASEYKAASLRWWTAAWSVARELKLGRELPPNAPRATPDQMQGDEQDADGELDMDMQAHGSQSANVPGGSMANEPTERQGFVSEEEREERRRIWWLLYTMDRHLALCYNRPLFLLDKECEGLLQPMNDTLWQAADSFPNDSNGSDNNPSSSRYRRRGPSFECTGHSIFGYFLPLMTILGEIVDLNHARNHPRFGLSFRSDSDWDDQANEIAQQLEAYGSSLREFEARYTSGLAGNNDGETAGDGSHNDVATPSVHSSSTVNSRMTESIIQTKIVVAYGTHVMHVLHILLTGKWDPISLLDDNDLWISSPSFIGATGHAVNAAEAISDIIEFDPDLTFMPFFFGIYLLQGSFLLLLIADKLQGEASPAVVKACETIVRAHEACVVTLNTEYQVSNVSLVLLISSSPIT